MIFRQTTVSGAWVIEPELRNDERGSFARTWDADEFARRGLSTRVDQCSVSFTHGRGTLRGLHFQAAPHEETKLVRCTRGAVFDVVVDLRPGSPTFRRWFGVELSAQNRLALYVPELCAHGLLTLSDDAEVYYQMSGLAASHSAFGVRFDDPAFGIEWPADVLVINERDRSYPDFEAEA